MTSNAPVPSAPIVEFIDAIASGLRQPYHAWTAVAIVVSLAGAWLFGRFVRRLVAARVDRLNAAAASRGTGVDLLKFSIEGLRRLATPIAALVLLWLAAVALRATHVFAAPADGRMLREAANLIGAWGAIRFGMFVLRRVFRNLALISAFDRVIGLVVWGLVALHLTGLLDDVIAWLDATKIPAGHATVSLWSVISAAVVILVALLAALWAGSAVESRLDAIDSLDTSVRVVLGRVARALLLVVAVLAGLQFAGIDLTILSVFGGALGVGLGLGLQRIASNYVSGFIILLDRSLRIGDIIAVDKFSGTVTQINTRYTVVNGGDGTEAIIPNEMLVSTPVSNQSLSDRRVRVAIRLCVAYGTDLEDALWRMQAAASANSRALAEPAPVALLTAFGACGVDIELGFWIADPGARGLAWSEVARAVYADFRAAGIQIPLPQREIRILGEAPSRASMEPGG
ncbi:MAG TPA: mechanosensitive ion channel domain-containing protein [Burkholderiaceae bacterium]|nr:mechanosensitive ion channel domain-containing protein [Burkholderiaceae bacterium]